MAYQREEKDEVIKGYLVDDETICPASINSGGSLACSYQVAC